MRMAPRERLLAVHFQKGQKDRITPDKKNWRKAISLMDKKVFLEMISVGLFFRVSYVRVGVLFGKSAPLLFMERCLWRLAFFATILKEKCLELDRYWAGDYF